ncbi:class I SAM-dependent methyltransferase [Staphylospora marina]|uniref:class I SAM-dependent methyltransferase n=1 Tax=Staphylospora marina TaxID=2490858 RepID=UPI000F5BB151|nr:class I SAM-dependent methyltransferase [Staphylospora marina]
MALGARFNELFERWAEEYDSAVSGGHPEYREVFEGYAEILKTVVNELALPPGSTILEFGPGTGNLSRLLVAAGYRVIGVEPSAAMRAQAAAKVPELELVEGHFLSVPDSVPTVDGIVSTWAFHHLTDEEKDRALADMTRLLRPGGKIVFADTVFVDEQAREAFQKEAEDRGFLELAEDLRREFYPVIGRLEESFRKAGFLVQFRRMNRYVWLMSATIA